MLRLHRILRGTAMALVLLAMSAANAGPVRKPSQTNAAAHPAPTAQPAPATPAAPPAPAPATVTAAATPDASTPEAAKPDAAKPDAAPTPAAAKPDTAPAPQAAVETTPPDPLASLDPADRPIAEKIRDLLAAKVDKIFATKKEHAAVEMFYQNRNLAPLWIEKGVESARAKLAIARLKLADTDGLVATDYKIPDFTGSDPEALAEAELRFTETILTYARHVQAGRFSYALASKNIELPQLPPEAADVLTAMADAPDAGKALDAYSPPQPGYAALKAKLAELRAHAGAGANEIPSGPDLKLTKVPMQDPRVPLLRAR